MTAERRVLISLGNVASVQDGLGEFSMQLGQRIDRRLASQQRQRTLHRGVLRERRDAFDGDAVIGREHHQLR